MSQSLPIPRAASIAMAALSPVALGGILALRAGHPSPLLAVPAIVFGVIATTAPALYIATAATGAAPPLVAMMRAFGVAIGAFGIVLAGLVLPSAFLSLTSLSATTTIAIATAALLGAGFIALRRLSAELSEGVSRSLSAWLVFGAWSLATLGIAGRLWWDFASEVVS
jgi:hypothetical protein